MAISIPMAIDRLVEGLGSWPSRGAFVKEARLEKFERERLRLREPRKAGPWTAQSEQGGKPCRGTKPGDQPP